jgi:hypothetical protein
MGTRFTQRAVIRGNCICESHRCQRLGDQMLQVLPNFIPTTYTHRIKHIKFPRLQNQVVLPAATTPIGPRTATRKSVRQLTDTWLTQHGSDCPEQAKSALKLQRSLSLCHVDDWDVKLPSSTVEHDWAAKQFKVQRNAQYLHELGKSSARHLIIHSSSLPWDSSGLETYLRHQPNLLPEPAQLQLPDVDTVEGHAAGGDVVEALDERHDSGLACNGNFQRMCEDMVTEGHQTKIPDISFIFILRSLVSILCWRPSLTIPLDRL